MAESDADARRARRREVAEALDGLLDRLAAAVAAQLAAEAESRRKCAAGAGGEATDRPDCG